MPDFSLNTLRLVTPSDYRRWATGSASLAAVGYSLVTVLAAVTESPTSIPHLSVLGLTALACWVGFGVCLAGRGTLGTNVVIAALWFELNGSYVVASTFPSAPLLATPILVVGTGLLYGSRVSLMAAVLSVSATTPLFLLSPAYARMGFAPEVSYWLTVHAVVTIATWGLVSFSLSALRRIFATVQERERELADLIATAPDGIIVLGSNGDVLVTNPAADRLLGDALVSHRGRSIGAVLADAGVSDASEVTARLAGSQQGAVSLVRPRPEGPPVHIEIVQRTLDQGRRRQLMLRDASTRATAEATQRATEQRIAHAQRLEAVGQLAGGIAHDFNNLLLAIGGNAELLRDETDVEQRSTLLEEILGAQQRGATLTHQLLAFARRDVVHPTVFELGELVSRVRPLLQRVAGEGVHVQCFGGDGCRVRADVTQMEQVLVNLVANARDAMPEGGVCTVEVVQSSDDRATARLSVRDTGIGMDPATVARAFEPFFTTKPRGRGTGLGLSTVHGIVTQSDGRMSIDSSPAHGTTIVMNFPLVTEEVGDGATNDVAEAFAGLGGTILVAEDDDSTRAVVGRLLQRAGYRVLLAPDGDQALRILLAKREEVDLLITDVIMPALTGRELATRAHDALPHLPILFMSGYTENELDGVASLDPGRDFIAKPFSGAEFLRRVAERLTPVPGA